MNSPVYVLTPAQQIFHQTLIVLHRFIVSILAVILMSHSVVLAEEVSKIASTYSDDLELQWIGYLLFWIWICFVKLFRWFVIFGKAIKVGHMLLVLVS